MIVKSIALNCNKFSSSCFKPLQPLLLIQIAQIQYSLHIYLLQVMSIKTIWAYVHYIQRWYYSMYLSCIPTKVISCHKHALLVKYTASCKVKNVITPMRKHLLVPLDVSIIDKPIYRYFDTLCDYFLILLEYDLLIWNKIFIKK